jgi:hypothetical protein
MNVRKICVAVMICIFAATVLSAGKRAGRRAGKGAAMGAIWGLVIGGSVESAARHAAAGAAMGAASGAIDDSYAKKDARRAAEAQAAEQARQAEAQRRAYEAERLRLEEEKRKLEQQMALVEAQETQALGQDDDAIQAEWIEAIGEDNWNGLIALTDCQHQRAHLLAQAGATVDNEEHRLASLWLEAMIVVDQKKLDEAAAFYEQLAARDPEVDTAQQASIEIDKAILDIRELRREEGISCNR